MLEQRYIFNVLVAGQSIGMTFNRAEAETWKSHSMHEAVEIRKVAYSGNPYNYRVYYD